MHNGEPMTPSDTPPSQLDAPRADAAPAAVRGARAYPPDPRLRNTLVLLGVTALPLVLLHGDPYWVNVLAYTYLFAGLASAWNIIGGFGGQFSLGHGVFFGVGAYTVARLYLGAGVTPWLGLVPAAIGCAALAALVSWPTFRLKGPFFAIATMAINEVCFALANYFDSVTGGPRGLTIPYRASLSNMIFAERWKYALLMFVFMALVVLVAVALQRSRLGYSLLAVREDEDAARAAGIDVLSVKLRGMALSAALTAVGGGLFAMYVRIIDPPSLFTLPEVGAKFALLALIGGVGTVTGPVVGAFLVVPLENWLRGAFGGLTPGAHLIVLGLLMVAASLFMKRGLVGAWQSLMRARRARSRP